MGRGKGEGEERVKLARGSGRFAHLRGRAMGGQRTIERAKPHPTLFHQTPSNMFLLPPPSVTFTLGYIPTENAADAKCSFCQVSPR